MFPPFVGDRCQLPPVIDPEVVYGSVISSVTPAKPRISLFVGDRCQLPPVIDPEVICGSVICLNGGICAIVEQGALQARCFCELGFSGPACELYQPCTLNPCQGRGNCIPTPTSFQCNCVAPYTGEYPGSKVKGQCHALLMLVSGVLPRACVAGAWV